MRGTYFYPEDILPTNRMKFPLNVMRTKCLKNVSLD